MDLDRLENRIFISRVGFAGVFFKLIHNFKASNSAPHDIAPSIDK